jgi:fucose 4-O-acetylase-like acetyltransferase
MQSDNVRTNFVDMAKGFAILFVVLGHIASPLGNFIFAWHMPLFFFLSGFFIKSEKKIKDMFWGNFRKLMISFYIFATLGLFLTVLKNILLDRVGWNFLDNLVGTYLWMDMSLMDHYGLVLWFLPALFWGKLFVFFLVKKLKNLFVIFLFLMLVFFILLITKINLPFELDAGLMSAPWIFCGYYYYKYIHQFVKEKIFILFTPVLFLPFLSISSMNIATNTYANPIYNFSYALLMISIVVALMCIFEKLNISRRIFTFLGLNSMFIFIFHPYTNNLVYVLIEEIRPGDWVLKFFISVLLIVGVFFLIKKTPLRRILQYV